MRIRLVSVLMSGLLLGTVSADSAQRAGLVQGADMVVFARAAQLNQSPFVKAMEAQLSPEERAERQAQQAKMLELTGLGEEDVESFMMSADLSGINPAAMDEAFLNRIQVAAAVGLRKAVTLEQLEKAVEALKEETGGVGGVAARVQVGGQEVLRFSPGPGETWDGPQQMFAGISPDGKTVVLTINEASLSAALGRAAGGPPAAPAAELGDALRGLANQHMAMALVLPQELRQQIQEQVQMMAGADPMAGMFIAPFAGVKSLVMAGRATETLNVRMALDIGNEMAAQQMAGMFTNMAGGLAGIGPVAQKLTARAEGTVMSLTGSLSPEDLKQDFGGGMDVDF